MAELGHDAYCAPIDELDPAAAGAALAEFARPARTRVAAQIRAVAADNRRRSTRSTTRCSERRRDRAGQRDHAVLQHGALPRRVHRQACSPRATATSSTSCCTTTAPTDSDQIAALRRPRPPSARGQPAGVPRSGAQLQLRAAQERALHDVRQAGSRPNDTIFPRCLTEMIALAEAYPSIGVVSAYRMFGAEVQPTGLPPHPDLPDRARRVPHRARRRHLPVRLADHRHVPRRPGARPRAVYAEGRLFEDGRGLLRAARRLRPRLSSTRC